jgi:flavin reductase (DIM6/NTAB) family NADH-FMN oxidoreductase RutF/DNA-binding IclR family transcriptional regulator
VVTSHDGDGTAVGMVIGSFTSVSLDPPLIGFFPTKSSKTFARLRGGRTFCVNVLGHEQESICRRIASRPEEGLDGIAWNSSTSGVPILQEALAWFECTYESILEAGDHYIVLGRVNDFGVTNPRSPLIFFQGGMGRFASPSMVVSEEAGLIDGVRLGELARTEMEALAQELRAECSAMVPVGRDLVLVAKANHSIHSDGTLLGTRVPLIAPMGEAFVAFDGDEIVTEWLERAGVSDEDAVERYRERLRAIRSRGWSMSLSGPPEDRNLYADFRRWANGELTPVQERSLSEKVSRLAPFYPPVEVDAADTFEVHSMVAPVIGKDGRPSLVLRLSQLPTAVNGQSAERIGQRLLESAAVMEDRLREAA